MILGSTGGMGIREVRFRDTEHISQIVFRVMSNIFKNVEKTYISSDSSGKL